jgi:hypothetical protein
MTPSPENPPSREERINEVIAGYLEAVQAGLATDRAALLALHPDLADELNAFFADRDRFVRAAEELGPAIPIPCPAPSPADTPTMAHGEPAPAAGPLGVIRYFGDYELLEEIARGGMGVVYKARQLSLNRIVALKMILAGQLASPADVQRFHAEAEAVANLDHPNIVPIYEVGEHEGQHYFSMKLIEGGSLALLSREPAASAAQRRSAAQFIATVARAVHFAHQRGIIHRDLKPANILLDQRGELHVTDFGLAKRVEGGTPLPQSGAIVGTPSYMAPEQARAAKGLTTAVDIYGLGAILYELLTGQPPFRADTPLDTILKVLECDPVHPRRLNPSADRDLATICLKCLEKDPTRRYTSASALADDLERWLDGQPVTARPVGSVERLIKWVRRRPAIAGLLTGVVLLTAIASALIGYFVLEAQDAKAREANAHAEEAEERLRHAEDKQQAILAEREQVDSTLAQILARPLGYQEGPLTVGEQDALWEVAVTKSDRVRLLFFDKAMASPESALRMRRRADLAVQAAVGLDTDRRARLQALLLHKLQDDDVDREVREVCACLGAALGEPEEALARKGCQALLAAMAATTDANALNRQARSVAILAACLPRAEVHRICAPETQHFLHLMAKTNDPRTLSQLGHALGALGRLGPNGTQVCAKGARIVLDLLAKPTDLEALSALGQALESLTEGLALDEAAKVCTMAVLAIMDRLADNLSRKAGNFSIPLLPVLYAEHSAERLATRLRPEEAARAARHALDSLGRTSGVFLTIGFGPVLEKLTERLEPDEAAKESRQVLDFMAKGSHDPFTLAALGKVFVKLGSRMRPDEVANSTKAVLKLMDSTKQPDNRAQLAESMGKLAKYLPAEEAASVCRQVILPLLRDMAESPKTPILAMLAGTVATVAERLPPDEAGRMCGQAIRPLLKLLSEGKDEETLYWLGPALGSLSERLEREEAARVCGQTTRALLDALAKSKTDDTLFRYTLASSLSLLAARLPAPESTRICATAMQTLLHVLDKTTDPATLSQLVSPLGQMAEQLSPEESARATRRIFDLLVRITEPITLSELAKAVAKLAERCSEQDQVELLKHPFCVAASRDAVRAALNKRLNQNSTSHWDLIAWLRQHRPDLDLATPPQRVERY